MVLAEPDGPVSLSGALHARTKILWQQRFFTQALGALIPYRRHL